MINLKSALFVRRSAFVAVLAAAIVPALGAQAAQREKALAGRIELTMKTGSDWSHVKKFGVAKVTLLPQFAVWLEREDGSYAAELLVTKKAAKSAWGSVRRPDALPVWSHSRGVRYDDGLFMPTKREPLADAVTGATPKPKTAGTDLRFDLNLPAELAGGRYRILVELNNSFDYNDVYAENLPSKDPKANGVNGQPSVVYAALLDLGDTDGVAKPLAFVGTGHPTGSDGIVREGRDGLTSALSIVESITIRDTRGRWN
jgi:hypothetical protein